MKSTITATVGLAALALGACDQGHTLSEQEMRNAQFGGQQYAMNADLKFIQCSGLDSEPDGYVSCEAKDKSTGSKVVLLCSYQGSSAGCKSK